MSSGLLFLSSEDFMIQNGGKGNLLCHRIPGYSLILFYSTNCPHCHNLIPIFKNLPGTIGGCQFGMINVSQNRQCVELSRQTIAPIKFVPYILLYFQGKPIMIYKGPANSEEIRRFIVEVANNMQRRQQFSNNKNVKHQVTSPIPEYCIGVPVKGDMVCYLDIEDAYQKK